MLIKTARVFVRSQWLVWMALLFFNHARGDCTLTNVGLIALPDLGWGSYSNFNRTFTGGLYPNGANCRPAVHETAGLQLAAQIQPLDTNGLPATNGSIVILSSGMSNTTQEWASKGTNHFTGQANRDPSKNPRLTIIDGAIGGQDAPAWTNLSAQTWSNVLTRLRSAGRSTSQVQVLWIKQAIAGESGALTNHAAQLQGHLEKIVRNAKTLFPNLKIGYLSSRTRAYVYGSGLNPEPFAYETAFAVKWLIEKQINGAQELNYDSAKGPVVAPWLSWGPYLWTDGLRGRSDGLLSVCPDDLESDFTHPAANGHVPKVGTQLLAFFKTDRTATPWFLRTNVVGQPPVCAPVADIMNGVVPLIVNFAANASDAEGSIRDYQWTFEDGTFSTNANPRKIFPTPGVYRACLTVTDTNGNTATGVVLINAQATFDLWRQAKFSGSELSNTNISGAAADPDSDGINNRLEYAFGLDPKTRNTGTNGLPRAAISNGVFTLTFTRFKMTSDSGLAVETSSNLSNWSRITPARIADDGLTETMRVEQNVSSGRATFFKFKVE
jgi:PKD repeat protein